MIKQQLQQKLQQRMSPQQVQLVRMLELSSLELEQRVKEELEENPALEEGAEPIDSSDAENEFENEPEIADPDFGLGDYISEDDVPSYEIERVNRPDKSEVTPFIGSSTTTFYDHLLHQIALRDLTDEQSGIAEYIIGNIEDDGYLRRNIGSIVDDLSFREGVNVTIQQAIEVLDIIQDLDPAGVGATSLQECLLLQLERMKATPALTVAYTILKDCFEEFSYKHFDKIRAKLSIDEELLKEAIEEIISLNPKPANAWNESTSQQSEGVTPDFLIETTDGEVYISLTNQNIPSLRVSAGYQHMIQDFVGNDKNRTQDNAAAVSFIKQKLDSARWFIDAVKQRQETLMTVMSAIVRYQRSFFLTGETSALRPMTLKNVAEHCPYDISTISRVSNSKYAETNFGIFSLKYFFHDSMQTESGEDVTSGEIKDLLAEFIEEEEKRTPLTDETLCDMLRGRGYLIARRTVAKYREQMNIPVARLRKQL